MIQQVKEVEEAKKVVEQMSYGLKFIDNPNRKAKRVEQLNTFINLINGVDKVLDRSTDADVIRWALRVVLLHCWLTQPESGNPADDLEEFIDNVTRYYDRLLMMGSQHPRDEFSLELAMWMVDKYPSHDLVDSKEGDRLTLTGLVRKEINEQFDELIESYYTKFKIRFGLNGTD